MNTIKLQVSIEGKEYSSEIETTEVEQGIIAIAKNMIVTLRNANKRPKDKLQWHGDVKI